MLARQACWRRPSSFVSADTIFVWDHHRNAAALKCWGLRRRWLPPLIGHWPMVVSTKSFMGLAYKREKRNRKLAHVKALLRAFVALLGDIPPPLRVEVQSLNTAGFKQLSRIREHLCAAAQEQGTGREFLYEVARRYAPIPIPMLVKFNRRSQRDPKALAIMRRRRRLSVAPKPASAK